MKKTFTINISGIIFNIDEDAYEALGSYLGRIRKHFTGQEGGSEICDDIEARIAELLGQRITETKQVITIEDVNEVTAVMGDAGEMEAEEETGQQGDRATGQQGTRRLFRDPEQRILGGVCGGLGVYFRLDPIIFRLIFIILIFSGFGIPLYLVLWIITPVAKTPSDHLQMRGEPVTVKNIERSVKSEWTHVRGTINGLASEAKDTYKKATPALGILLENLGKACLAVLKVFWGILRVIIGILLIFIGLTLLFVLLVALFGWFGPMNFGDSDVLLTIAGIMQLLVGPHVNTGLLSLTILAFLGIPVFLLFYSGLRLAFKMPKLPYAGLTAFNIWVVSLILLIYFGVKISNNYRMEQTVTSRDVAIGELRSDTLYLRLDSRITDSLQNTMLVTSIKDPGLYVTGGGSILVKPELIIAVSNDSLFHLTSNVTSRDRSTSDAIKASKSVHYHYTVNDSLVVFDPIAILPAGEAWKMRNIKIKLEVPKNKHVVLDTSVYRILKETY